MPAHRKPLAQARLTGAMARNPQRYRGRSEPVVDEPLGEPPDWLPADAAVAWRDFDRVLPWLNKSHRAITVIASMLQARMAAGTLGVPGMNLLRIVLGQLGATPAMAGKVAMPSLDDDDGDDLLD